MRRIQAIPTTYDGYTFRSKTEAKWALFFNKIGLPYTHELDGYQISKYRGYLPDFYTEKNGGWFIEVKGSPRIITTQEWAKIKALNKNPPLNAKGVILVCGHPSPDITFVNWVFPNEKNRWTVDLAKKTGYNPFHIPKIVNAAMETRKEGFN